MIPLVCEFCHQAVAIEDAVIFGPPEPTSEELTSLADRTLRRDPELELVFLHPECELLLDDRADSR